MCIVTVVESLHISGFGQLKNIALLYEFAHLHRLKFFFFFTKSNLSMIVGMRKAPLKCESIYSQLMQLTAGNYL